MKPPSAAIALAAALALSGAGHAADARDDGNALRDAILAHRATASLRVSAVATFDPARLGHVTLPTRLTITNTSRTPIALGGRGIELVARGPLRTHACEERSRGDRLPAILEPGAQAQLERTVVCETTLPASYVLEARWENAADSDPPLASAPFRIDPGPSPPVPLSTRPALHAIATGTREVVPTNAPGRVRVVLGLTNATSRAVSLPTIVIQTSLHLRGSKLTCQDRREVVLAGELAAGAQHVVWMPLSCALPTEGTWEVDVDVGEPQGPPVRLPSHVVHASALPTPLPPPPR